MELNQIIEKHFPFFEKALQEQMGEVGQIRQVKSGDVLMKTGQNIRATMLVLDGLIKIFREDEEGNEFFMYYLQPGEACALSMVCAIKNETSQIMAKAVQDTEVLSIPIQYMDQWMASYKSWYHFVITSYRQRFEDMLQTIDHIAFRNMDERLVFYLQQHLDVQKNNIVQASYTEIAQELNSSREVISRLMKKLAEKGLIRQHKTHTEIIDLKKLLS
ncbi:MAG: Crp/Fnr family transcriptional regulator [Chitinophagaceae bacterium]|jgi:CRP/FNR family transcriptional regulator|nr:Crp/Fnr family transcriptional regulator [Chitinophagaceae bacterium]